jgi:hypothetical protein
MGRCGLRAQGKQKEKKREWSGPRKRKLVGYAGKIEKRGRKSGLVARPILVRKNKNGLGLISGIIFLFDFPKPLYKL